MFNQQINNEKYLDAYSIVDRTIIALPIPNECKLALYNVKCDQKFYHDNHDPAHDFH